MVLCHLRPRFVKAIRYWSVAGYSSASVVIVLENEPLRPRIIRWIRDWYIITTNCLLFKDVWQRAWFQFQYIAAIDQPHSSPWHINHSLLIAELHFMSSTKFIANDQKLMRVTMGSQAVPASEWWAVRTSAWWTLSILTRRSLTTGWKACLTSSMLALNSCSYARSSSWNFRCTFFRFRFLPWRWSVRKLETVNGRILLSEATRTAPVTAGSSCEAMSDGNGGGWHVESHEEQVIIHEVFFWPTR